MTIHSVIEEECSGIGALDAARRVSADAALVTESELMRFTRACLGVMWFRIQIAGKAWHAMEARRGVNAISKTVPIIRALEDLDRQLNETVHPDWAGVEHPINLKLASSRAEIGRARCRARASCAAGSASFRARRWPRCGR